MAKERSLSFYIKDGNVQKKDWTLPLSLYLYGISFVIVSRVSEWLRSLTRIIVLVTNFRYQMQFLRAGSNPVSTGKFLNMCVYIYIFYYRWWKKVSVQVLNLCYKIWHGRTHAREVSKAIGKLGSKRGWKWNPPPVAVSERFELSNVNTSTYWFTIVSFQP